MENFNDIESTAQHDLSRPTKHKQQINIAPTSLHEPIKETILRDLNNIQTKLKFFFTFNKKTNPLLENEIRNYDLWGPFVFFLLFAVTTSIYQANIEKAFTIVILLLAIGSLILASNSRLLKVNLSILQGNFIRHKSHWLFYVPYERCKPVQMPVPFSTRHACILSCCSLYLLLHKMRT